MVKNWLHGEWLYEGPVFLDRADTGHFKRTRQLLQHPLKHLSHTEIVGQKLANKFQGVLLFENLEFVSLADHRSK